MTRPSSLADLATIFDSQPISGMRNRIINGDMRIDQRNAGASRSCTAGAITYVTDRWFLFPAGATLTAQQVAGTNTSTTRAFRISGATGSTLCNFEQRIEDLNIQDLTSQIVTFRARVWCSTTVSNVTVYAISPTVVNNYGFITTSFDTPITLNAGLNNIVVTGTLNSGATLGQAVGIAFKSGIGNGVTVDISEVQLEAGAFATPFERRQFGQELALCQRYYEKSYDISVTPGTATQTGAVFVPTQDTTRANQGATVSFAAEKRATPTITYYDVAGNISRASAFDGSANRTDNHIQAAPTYSIGTRSITWRASNGIAQASAIAYQYVASAEL